MEQEAFAAEVALHDSVHLEAAQISKANRERRKSVILQKQKDAQDNRRVRDRLETIRAQNRKWAGAASRAERQAREECRAWLATSDGLEWVESSWPEFAGRTKAD